MQHEYFEPQDTKTNITLLSTLYLIATPIGNLGDISLRAIELLKEVDYVACEDTRTSGKLLKLLGLNKQIFSFHAHNEHHKVHYLIDLLKAGKSVALISDAGSPGISDPGFLAVSAAIEAGIKVCPIPGASALIVALSASGLPSDRFVFEGFLPHKKGRQSRWKKLIEEERTMIFYESPYRIGKILKEINDYLGAERRIVLARELTKKFEEFVRGSAGTLLALHQENQLKLKGEFVVMVEGKISK